MTKNATVWRPLSGQGDVTNGTSDDFLLLETADKLLLETGDDALLEDTVFVPKETTAWSEA